MTNSISSPKTKAFPSEEITPNSDTNRDSKRITTTETKGNIETVTTVYDTWQQITVYETDNDGNKSCLETRREKFLTQTETYVEGVKITVGVIIAGGSGFINTQIAKHLAENNFVVMDSDKIIMGVGFLTLVPATIAAITGWKGARNILKGTKPVPDYPWG